MFIFRIDVIQIFEILLIHPSFFTDDTEDNENAKMADGNILAVITTPSNNSINRILNSNPTSSTTATKTITPLSQQTNEEKQVSLCHGVSAIFRIFEYHDVYWRMEILCIYGVHRVFSCLFALERIFMEMMRRIEF